MIMRATPLHRGLCALGMVLAQSARLLSQTDTVGAKVLATIVRDYPCGKHAFTVSSVTARAVPHACSLARLAIHQIGVGAASKLGVSPEDTMHVQAARVVSFDFKDLSGGEGEYYWSVALVLSNHPFWVDVTIDKLSGAVRTSLGEGPDASPIPSSPRRPPGREPPTFTSLKPALTLALDPATTSDDRARSADVESGIDTPRRRRRCAVPPDRRHGAELQEVDTSVGFIEESPAPSPMGS
jgi:hypothetical protein